MPISSRNPKYQEIADDWRTMRDWCKGERAVRADVKRYLPPPPGLLGQGGTLNLNEIISNNYGGSYDRYAFYAMFAEFVDITNTTINAIQGLIHEKPPTIELPTEFEYLLESATPNGDTIEELWEMVTREVLQVGRITLLSEVIGDELFLCPYRAESLINWHVLPKLMGGGPILAVLEEVVSRPKEDDQYKQEDVTFYRELVLDTPDAGEGGDPVYRVRLWKARDGKDPEVVYDLPGADPQGFVTPVLFGNEFGEIPITVINAINKGFQYGPIPALPMAKRAIWIYRKTADYHRALYIKGDPQPILFGVDAEDMPGEIGGGEIWAFPNEAGKAQYLDIDGQGIPYMKESIDQQYERFGQETGQLADDSGGGIESEGGRARRYARADITIKSMVVNAGAAMQSALQALVRARRGPDADVSDVIFEANTDFSEPLMSGKALLDYVMAKNAGAPLSAASIHELARRHKVTDKDFETEMDEIADEGDQIDLFGPPPAPAQGEAEGEETRGKQQVEEAEDVDEA